MKDIPIFTTENGVASLILQKIPFTREAYVKIQDSCSCEALVRECVDFCRMAGAKTVYATGHSELNAYPEAFSVFDYVVLRELLSETDAVSLPVAMEQADWWRKTYNQKMSGVHAASVLSVGDAEQLIREHKAFYICRDCAVLGIGVAYGGRIQALASVLPGCGRDVVLSLAACLEGAQVSLQVASTNSKAIRLYTDLGFEKNCLGTVWYKIFPC